MVLVGGTRQFDENDPQPIEGSVLDRILAAVEQIVDAQERIEQQLAKINEGENLKPGERHYG